ncbi:CD82 antigen [Liparis tanakae]|uniref:CD82 antigen n=1 Tax=Liparis tanakae TaxID=230148 RepID=A0A4Z2GZ99_9TELE|nr:CD82 antigen [Liparis tanakae]
MKTDMKASIMGKGCLTATKYFLFLFNLVFFLCGAVIMGFGLWLLLDNQSFIVVLNNSTSVKVACYILIGVGAFSMLMGFLGCLGAIYEIRCLLGLYFTCLLLILIAQVVAGALIYFQKDVVSHFLFPSLGLLGNLTAPRLCFASPGSPGGRTAAGGSLRRNASQHAR